MQLIIRLSVASTVLHATRSSTRLTKMLVFKLHLTVSNQSFTSIVSAPTKVQIHSAKPKSISGPSRLLAQKSSLNWAVLERPSHGQPIFTVKLHSEFLIARVPLPSMSASGTHRVAWTLITSYSLLAKMKY